VEWRYLVAGQGARTVVLAHGMGGALSGGWQIRTKSFERIQTENK